MHPVIELLIKRRREGSLPGKRKDRYKLGLAIEGGGMRGVVSAGMVSALEYLGMLNVFDAIYGTSAGAINAAYFLAGQAAYGTTIYYENINNNKFINIFRFFSGKPIMSLDFLLFEVAVNEKILDCEAIINSPISFKIIASSVTRPGPVILDKFNSPDALLKALRASARIPLIAGPPVELNGDHYLDGGIFESVPFKSALQDGCTHVLALLTRPDGRLRGRPTFVEKYFVSKYLALHHADLAKAFLNRPKRYSEDISIILNKTMNPTEPPFIFGIRLGKGSETVARVEKRRDTLVYGAIKGMQAVFQIITEKKLPLITEILCPFGDKGHIERQFGLFFKQDSSN